MYLGQGLQVKQDCDISSRRDQTTRAKTEHRGNVITNLLGTQQFILVCSEGAEGNLEMSEGEVKRIKEGEG